MALGTYEFGPYRLDTATRRLTRGDEVVALTPKAFDTLAALIERRDRVVDKAELMKVVWPDSFVEEANLSQTIFVLRKTLGEDESGRQYIDTIPRRGYRFAGPVRVAAEGAATPDHANPSTRRTLVRTIFPALAAIVVAVLVAGIWRVRQPAAATPQVTRIAVLPFENLSGNREDDWLASAFSDSLTAGLERARDVVTVSRDRVIELYQRQGLTDGGPLDGQALRSIASSLQLRYYVHGSYQRLGGDLRVSARIVDIDAGTNVLQESVTGPFASLLRLQDELSMRFGSRLTWLRTTGDKREAVPAIEAYRAAVEARNLYAVGNLAASRDLLQRAVDIDPGYAMAWALLSKALSRLSAVSTFTSGSLEALHAGAVSAAERAATLAPDLVESHIALALAYRNTQQLDRWRAAAQRAIELNPQHAEGWELLGHLFKSVPADGCARPRDPARAEQAYRKAIELDPLLGPAWGNLAYHYRWLMRVEDGLRVTEEGLERVPYYVGLRRARSTMYLWLNRLDEAERDIRSLPALSIQDHHVLANIALLRGDGEKAREGFEAVLRDVPGTVWVLTTARSYLAAGDIESGVAYIERAVKMDPACAQFAAETPAFAPYQDHPTFRARVIDGASQMR